jgi:hypothetical protein
MPISSQALYFHLGMNADDDGFIQPKITMRQVGSTDDDLKVLLTKRFLLAFETGVVVVKHWLIHNLIQKDRYHPTRFQEEKTRLTIKENKAYTEASDSVNKMLPEVRLGKVINTRAKRASTKTMKHYNENQHHEDLPSVDNETGEVPVRQKEPSVLPAYRKMLAWSEDRRGTKFVRPTYQYKAFKDARIAGISPVDMKAKWIELEAQGKDFDWNTVVAAFDRKQHGAG